MCTPAEYLKAVVYMYTYHNRTTLYHTLHFIRFYLAVVAKNSSQINIQIRRAESLDSVRMGVISLLNGLITEHQRGKKLHLFGTSRNSMPWIPIMWIIYLVNHFEQYILITSKCVVRCMDNTNCQLYGPTSSKSYFSWKSKRSYIKLTYALCYNAGNGGRNHWGLRTLNKRSGL